MEKNNKTGRLQIPAGTMESKYPPKNAENRLKENRFGTLVRKNRLLWQRRENTVNKETAEEIERKREFQRVENKIRNLPKPDKYNRRKTALKLRHRGLPSHPIPIIQL